MRALCKLSGALVIGEFTRTPPGRDGKCPTCSGSEFSDAPHGWIECRACGFAILRSDYDKMMAIPYQLPFIGWGI